MLGVCPVLMMQVPPGCSRYSISIKKPLGIVLEQNKDTGVITVAEISPEGNAAKTGLVAVVSAEWGASTQACCLLVLAERGTLWSALLAAFASSARSAGIAATGGVEPPKLGWLPVA